MSKSDYCYKCGQDGHVSASCKRRYLQRGFAQVMLIKLVAVLALAAGAVALYQAKAASLREEGRVEGRREVQAKWDKEKSDLKDAALAEARENALETKRRLEAQRRNQEIQNVELARARDDARLNAAAADRLREQNVATARQWSAALGDAPTREQLAAAASAIGVLTDLLGRADRRAGVLASFADASRAAGLKCERDYDSLTPAAKPPEH